MEKKKKRHIVLIKLAQIFLSLSAILNFKKLFYHHY